MSVVMGGIQCFTNNYCEGDALPLKHFGLNFKDLVSLGYVPQQLTQ